MLVLSMAVAPFWMALVGSVSALITAFAFWKPKQQEPKVWGADFDHEAAYQRLREKVGNGK